MVPGALKENVDFFGYAQAKMCKRDFFRDHYYPFGLTLQTAAAPNVTKNPLKLATKELESSFGLGMYNFGARTFDMAGAPIWGQIDPLAEKYYSISPYAYCLNNPVLFKDPDGRKVVIGGNEAALTFKELGASVKSNLTLYTNKDGSVGANINFHSFTPMTEGAKQLYGAISDNTVTVNVNATNSTTTSDGSLYIGGAFMGNTVDQGGFPGNFDNTVETKQDINPGVLKKMDDYYSKPGGSTLHEVTESYIGGVTSKESGVSAGNGKTSPDAYKAAHEKASPQSGPVYSRYYDKGGNEQTSPSETTTKVNFTVQEGNRPEEVIQTLK